MAKQVRLHDQRADATRIARLYGICAKFRFDLIHKTSQNLQKALLSLYYATGPIVALSDDAPTGPGTSPST
jgi:hypothetical protein